MQPEISWVNMHIEALNARKILHYPRRIAEDLLNTVLKSSVARHWKHRVSGQATCPGIRPVILPPKICEQRQSKDNQKLTIKRQSKTDNPGLRGSSCCKLYSQRSLGLMPSAKSRSWKLVRDTPFTITWQSSEINLINWWRKIKI